MNQERQITVSLRLCEADYRALQVAAAEEYTTMSGLLRRLLGGYLKGERQHEQAHGTT